jgi:hypothetical protein
MNHPAQFDIVGIGNAIVDVLAHADEGFIEAHGMQKGSMTLVDERFAETLYREMGPAVEMSGGSCANTIAAAASLGIRVAFIGKVADDQLGRAFRHAGGSRRALDRTLPGVRDSRCSAHDGHVSRRQRGTGPG